MPPGVIAMRTESLEKTQLPHQVEANLIRACSVTLVTEDRRAMIRSLAGECRDWGFITELCQTHGVSSLVGSNLEAQAADLVPRQIREIFQARFRANACRNLFLMHELLGLVREFRGNGMEVIPFKGPLLAITAYGNVALREFLDLDFLVQRSNLNRAGQLLSKRGYQAAASKLTEEYTNSQLGCEYVRCDGRVGLELHWTFLQTWLGFNVDLEAIWAAPPRVMVGQVPVCTLPAEIMLLYLCAHGAKHCWNRLCWVVDVAEVLRTRPDLNWQNLLVLAESMGCQRTLFIGLHLAKTQLGASIREWVWTRVLRDRLAVSLARDLSERMLTRRTGSSHIRLGWVRDWFHIRTKERWQEKVLYLWLVARLAFRPSDKDRQWIDLPNWLHWLYPFMRPIRVTWQLLSAFPRGNQEWRAAK
jgi:hypothetical protein